MTKKKPTTSGQRRKIIASFSKNLLLLKGKWLPKSRRVALIFDWYAIKNPYDFLNYNELLKCMEGYGHWPRLDNKEVERVRSLISSARGILDREYQHSDGVGTRSLITAADLGARATIDNADRLKHRLPVVGIATERQTRRLTREAEAIDPKSIPDTAEYGPLLKYLRGVRGLRKQIQAGNYLNLMLPPPLPGAQKKDESAKPGKKKK